MNLTNTESNIQCIVFDVRLTNTQNELTLGGRKWEKGYEQGKTAIKGSKPKSRFILSTVTQL